MARLLAIVCLVGLAACDGASSRRIHSQIEVSPRAVDFGSVAVGSSPAPLTVTIRNTGESALTLNALELQPAAGPAFAASFDADVRTLDPAESLVVTLSLNAAVIGVFGGVLHIETDADNTPLVDVPIAARVLGVTGDAGEIDAGAADAGAADAGVTDAGVTDAGLTDAGVTDAGVTDAGSAPPDGGCIGTWRLAPSEGTSNVYSPNQSLWEPAPYFDGGLFFFNQSNASGAALSPFEYRVVGDAGVRFDLGAPNLAGDCNDSQVGHFIVRNCWTGAARYELTTRTWSATATRPAGVPLAGSGRAFTAGSAVFMWSSGVGYFYDPTRDVWSGVTDAGLDRRVDRGFSRGDDVVLHGGNGPADQRLWVLTADAGAWRTLDVLRADGGRPVVVGGTSFGSRLLVFANGPSGPRTPWELFDVNLDDGGVAPLPTTGPAPTTANKPRAFVLAVGGRVVAIIPPTNNLPAPNVAGESYVLDVDAGLWSSTGGEDVVKRGGFTLGASGEAVYAYGGAAWDLALDGGVARGLLYELRPPSTTWVALDSFVLGAPAVTPSGRAGPPVIASPARNRALLAAAPGAMFDPVTLQWEPLPRWPLAFDRDFKTSNRAVGDGDTLHVAGTVVGGASLSPGGAWSLWPDDAGFTQNATVSPVLMGSDVFGWHGAGIYFSPVSSTWAAATDAGAPVGNGEAIIATAGSDRVFVWGGFDAAAGGWAQSGALYDRTLGTWSPISLVGATPAATAADTLWTGSEVLVLGGRGVSGNANPGFHAFNPTTNSWRALATPAGYSPSSGTRMVAVSNRVLALTPSGAVGVYTPGTNTWQCVNPPPRGFLLGQAISVANVNGRVVVISAGDDPYFAAASLEGL